MDDQPPKLSAYMTGEWLLVVDRRLQYLFTGASPHVGLSSELFECSHVLEAGFPKSY